MENERAMTAPVRTRALAPLVKVIATSVDCDVVAETIRSVSVLKLDMDGWQMIDEVVRWRLSQRPALQVVSAAASIPVERTRVAVQALLNDDRPQIASAARAGLIEARDVATVVAYIDELQSSGGWQGISQLPATTLETANLNDTFPSSREDEPWRAIAFAKAGELGPLHLLLSAITRDEGPPLFWGDPEYIAVQLQACQPMPAAAKTLLESELASIDQSVESDRHRTVCILVAGLLTRDMVQNLAVWWDSVPTRSYATLPDEMTDEQRNTLEDRLENQANSLALTSPRSSSRHTSRRSGWRLR